MPLCPSCGNELKPKDKGFIVDLDRNLIIQGCKKVRLTPTEAELAFILYEGSPSWVRRGHIMDGVYGMANDDPDPDILKVWLSRIRKKMRDVGIKVSIETGWYKTGERRTYRMIANAD